MLEFIIVAHAPLASALKALAAHTYAECGGEVLAIDVEPGDDVERVAARLAAAIGSNEALVLTDMFGATPCNAARRVADGRRVRVVAGVNLPMLWRTLCYRALSLDELVAKAVEGGLKGVMHVPSELPPPNQGQAPASHAEDPDHHQQ